MTKFLKLAVLLGLVATLLTGCAVNRATGSVDPSANLSSIKTMYVKKVAEDDNTYALIADKLRTKGVSPPAAKRHQAESTPSSPTSTNGCGTSPCTCWN